MHSLRGRLTLGLTVVLAAVLAVAGGTASRYVDRSERSALDDRLRRTVELSRETALVAFQRGLPGNDRRLDNVLSATGTTLRLYLGRTVVLDTGATPPQGTRRPVNGLRTFTAGGARYRSYTTALRDPGLRGLARVQVVTQLTSLERRQAALDRRLEAIGLAALVVAALATWFAAELVLRPLRRLRALTSNIAGTEDLDRRLPADDGPTELRSLAASFNGMLARLGRSAEDRERALAATRRFTADAGHELRTPLTSVQATLSALSRHPDIAPERRAELVGDALAEHRRLVDLLDGLQAMARGDAAGVEHAELDFGELVAETVEEAAARHPAVTWTPRLPGSPIVLRGWAPGLRRLVDNLLENAARHGRADGAVEVALSGAQDGAPAVLHVDDDGPGVADAERERIFAPFARAQGTSAPGSGLGLALVAQQARAHDATVAVTRSPQGGARFTVRFEPGRADAGADGV